MREGLDKLRKYEWRSMVEKRDLTSRTGFFWYMKSGRQKFGAWKWLLKGGSSVKPWEDGHRPGATTGNGYEGNILGASERWSGRTVGEAGGWWSLAAICEVWVCATGMCLSWKTRAGRKASWTGMEVWETSAMGFQNRGVSSCDCSPRTALLWYLGGEAQNLMCVGNVLLFFRMSCKGLSNRD